MNTCGLVLRAGKLNCAAVAFVALTILHPLLSHADDERGVLAKTLLSQSEADESGIDIRGWVSGTGTWNPARHDNGFNGPISFNDRADRVQMDQFYVIGERKITENEWSLGGRFDFTYGADSAFTTSRGFDDQLTTNGVSHYYKAAIPQAYAELATPFLNGATVKVGHFYTLLGYEVVPAKDNFFQSHSYSMQYGEPFTHWGALMSTSVCDDLTFTVGAVRGWDNLSDSADGNLAFLGGATYTASEDTTVVFSLISGNEGSGRNQTGYSAVVTHSLTDSLTYVFQHDFGRTAASADSNSAQWYSVANYLIKKISDTVSIGGRAEWFRDDDGVRVFGLRSGVGGVPANYFEFTFGANVAVTPSVMFRPEVRYDNQELIHGATEHIFNGGRDSSQIISAANVIVSF